MSNLQEILKSKDNVFVLQSPIFLFHNENLETLTEAIKRAKDQNMTKSKKRRVEESDKRASDVETQASKSSLLENTKRQLSVTKNEFLQLLKHFVSNEKPESDGFVKVSANKTSWFFARDNSCSDVEANKDEIDSVLVYKTKIGQPDSAEKQWIVRITGNDLFVRSAMALNGFFSSLPLAEKSISITLPNIFDGVVKTVQFPSAPRILYHTLLFDFLFPASGFFNLRNANNLLQQNKPEDPDMKVRERELQMLYNGIQNDTLDETDIHQIHLKINVIPFMSLLVSQKKRERNGEQIANSKDVIDLITNKWERDSLSFLNEMLNYATGLSDNVQELIKTVRPELVAGLRKILTNQYCLDQRKEKEGKSDV